MNRLAAYRDRRAVYPCRYRVGTLGSGICSVTWANTLLKDSCAARCCISKDRFMEADYLALIHAVFVLGSVRDIRVGYGPRGARLFRSHRRAVHRLIYSIMDTKMGKNSLQHFRTRYLS